jgi:membrane-anchored mycosin MYCP
MTRTTDHRPPTYRDYSEYAFRDREVLVAAEHCGLVIDALKRWSIDAEVLAESSALGLSRLELTPRDPAHSIASALPEMEEYFADRYAGWTPTLGKNRIVGRVLGGGQLSWGGDGEPTPAEAPTSWPWSRGGAGREARVVILDTAAASQSPLTGNWLTRYSDTFDVAADNPVPAGHATFVAGLVLSKAPAATVEVRRVLDRDGQASAWDVATAIVDAGRSGADVINLSLVCYTEDGRPPLAMSQAISRLDPEIVVIAAAGNHGDHPQAEVRRRPTWPAALPNVVAVGACDAEGRTASFTPRDVPWIDVLADGVEVVSTYLDGAAGADRESLTTFPGWAAWSGTSFASGLVSGLVAAGMDGRRVSARVSLENLLRRAEPNGEPGEPPVLH